MEKRDVQETVHQEHRAQATVRHWTISVMRCAGSRMLKRVLDANEVQEFTIGYIYKDLRTHSLKRRTVFVMRRAGCQTIYTIVMHNVRDTSMSDRGSNLT